MAREIPVYLFVGFLESGKSRFIQQTLEDERFNGGEKTLLLCCEQGEEEFEPDYFASPNVFIEYVEDSDDLSPEYLKGLIKKHRIDKVMVEYNGMWLLEELYNALPREMVVYQQFTFIDSRTFESYNNNMRNLMVDKLRDCELVVFNRYADDHDKMFRHKVVRASNRMCEIAYEYSEQKIVYDDIIDPPPYDINAPIVEIEDKDFAWWYSDILNDPKYDYLFTVEDVNRLALSGIPFREAYRQVGMQVQNHTYSPTREVHHTHEGSIGNLCNDRIREKLQQVMAEFE